MTDEVNMTGSITEILDAYGTITHLNIRKYGPEDNRVLAIDIKISNAPARERLQAIGLGIEWAEGYPFPMGAFFDADGLPAFWSMDQLTSKAEVIGLEAVICGVRFTSVSMKKIKLRCADGRTVLADFQLTIEEPRGLDTAVLAEYVGEDVRVYVAKVQMDLPLEGDSGE